MRKLLPLYLVSGLFMFACGTSEKPDATVSNTSVDPSQSTVGEAGDWRSGDSLLTVMGDLNGKVVADMFDADGYYAWKLMGAGARVLVIDDNPANIAAIEARKKAEGIGDDRLLIRSTRPGSTGLMPNEVDLALITREYSQLGDRPAWFAQLMTGLRAPQTFFLVNYFPEQTPEGPPLSQRMAFNTVADEVTEFGFGDVGILYKKMPYRYILFGAVVPPDTGGPDDN